MILFCTFLSFNELFTAEEFLYLNQWGEIALLSVGNLSERILMSNTTYVSNFIIFFISQRRYDPWQFSSLDVHIVKQNDSLLPIYSDNKKLHWEKSFERQFHKYVDKSFSFLAECTQIFCILCLYDMFWHMWGNRGIIKRHDIILTSAVIYWSSMIRKFTINSTNLFLWGWRNFFILFKK